MRILFSFVFVVLLSFSVHAQNVPLAGLPQEEDELTNVVHPNIYTMMVFSKRSYTESFVSNRGYGHGASAVAVYPSLKICKAMVNAWLRNNFIVNADKGYCFKNENETPVYSVSSKKK